MNTPQFSETVGAIAANDYRNTYVFNQLGIDYSYAGNKTLEEASREVGLTEEHLRSALKHVAGMKTIPSQEFNKWDLDYLIGYITDTHHRYAKENAIIIYGLAQKVAYRQNEQHPELIKLATALFFFIDALLTHLKKEEQILFPNIRQLVKKKSFLKKTAYTTFGFIKESAAMMRKEHLAAGKELKLFRKLTNDYALPADALASHKYLFEKMEEFENDLFLHVHLENNILFPKAIALDEKITLQEEMLKPRNSIA